MPKAAPFTRKPGIEKLPLAVRKDIRDSYESEKEGFETTISELLGTPFHVNVNAGEVWAYNLPDSNMSAGGILKGYVEGFIDALKDYVERYGEEGKTHFNDAVTQSELTVNVNELGDEAETISADIKDGVFRILFHHQKMGYNQSDLKEFLLKAVEDVPRAGLSITAKNSIEEDYNEQIEELTKEIGEIIAMPDVILDPNFEENYAALDAVMKDKDWHWGFGRATFQYFSEGLKYQLNSQGFKDDDMLQEGLAEYLQSKTFKIRVVPQTKNDDIIETVLEGGVVYIQMTAQNWWYNTGDAGSGLIDLL
ncbi:hypothetical protein D9615_007013 [Tricholomella constricta]|uniref:Uncharacterized protein n=1 Tax=Tricholomella constricta TaxID=117010 RepID=A0A8H5H8S7_9AGAR|nr:hypothetical protein D9615_007013 [Tricholomella constricta]